MAKTYAVIALERLPGKTRQEIVARDLDAKAAARTAVKTARAGDSAFVVPMGSRIDNVVMMCSRSVKTQRQGARAARSFVTCSPMSTFKQQLRTPKKRKRR